MTEENVSADRPVREFLFEFVSKEAKPGSAVENQNLVRIGTDFDA